MTTQSQEEFWASLGQGNSEKNEKPLAPILRFSAMNKPIQGTVLDVYMTTEKGFNGAPDPTDKNGNPRPMMVLTLKLVSEYTGMEKGEVIQLKAGDEGRVFLKTDLLWKTRDAMAAVNLSSLPVGALWGGAWVDQEQLSNGTAKRHKVQVKVK